MTLTTAKLKDFIFYLALFSLIPLWNIPHTIAARYVCEALLLILVFCYPLNWRPILDRSRLIFVFVIYLLIQIFFFSSDLKVALLSFKSEWMHFILFSLVGTGSGLLIAKKQVANTLLYLGLAFSVPILIHLTLLTVKGFSSGSIPWGYWGLSDTHGDLAYTSLQAVIFLSVFLFCQAKQASNRALCVLLLLASVLSVVFAQSRGGLIFTVLAVLLTWITFIFFTRSSNSFNLKNVALSFLLLAAFGLIAAFGSHHNPQRWLESPIRALSALKSDPFLGLCSAPNTVPLNDKGEIQTILNPEQIEARARIMHGDSARVILAKAGFELSAAYPFGFNGSKEAYQQAIIKYCGRAPFVEYSHTHNAWIDTSLAIGIPGAILLLLVMLNYGWQGFRMIKQGNKINPFALALFVSAGIWILRGILDSTLRDQMLEMQAFILAFLLASAMSYQAKMSGTK
ncbi:MAG: O-antigen ligase family protein [Polynucleobacter sp.]|nr:O-antigen ligase family protein [Polynucleobacter sp.]